MREELFHLAVKLGSQGFVRSQQQCRSLDRFHHIGHGVGLARTGHAQQNLIALLALNAGQQFGNSLRLITGRRIVRNQFEFCAALDRRAAFGNEDGCVDGVHDVVIGMQTRVCESLLLSPCVSSRHSFRILIFNASPVTPSV